MSFYEDYYDYEIPKYRKKKVKSVKKSNHKHIYEPRKIEHCFGVAGYRDNIKRKWVTVICKCQFCDKEKTESMTLANSEFNELIVKLKTEK